MVGPPMQGSMVPAHPRVKSSGGRLQRGGGCVKRPALPPPLRSPEDAPAIGPARFTLVGLAFLASGAAALVYQVVWQRIMALHMGMSLPFLVRAIVRDTATASRTIGTLYGINVLGASLGALVTPWLLIRFQGMEGAVLWGVAGNALAGSAALLAGVGAKRAGTPPEAAPVASAAPL